MTEILFTCNAKSIGKILLSDYSATITYRKEYNIYSVYIPSAPDNLCRKIENDSSYHVLFMGN